MGMFDAQIRTDKKKAAAFISKLVRAGIPRKAIATNDFNSSLTNKVYITIPYGRKGGGMSRGYMLWNDNTLKLALRFWRHPV